MCEILNEDEYWERRREEWENPRAFRKPGAWDEPVYENGSLFLDDEIEKIEKERGYPMEELYEGDLLEIVEEQEGIAADSAKWNSNYGCIDYRYRVAQEGKCRTL